MKLLHTARCAALTLLGSLALGAQAQTDYSVYGVADLSYGRFEPSGLVREMRFNSNSLTATFVGVNLKHGFDDGWTPGITLETFVRFQDGKTGRRDSDPLLSRNAFVSLASPYGTLRIGRLQSFLFDATVRFNALGNSVGFSPAVRHVFASGNLESVQGDFYWNRALSYQSPNYEGFTLSLMGATAPTDTQGGLSGGTLIYSRGLLAVALSAQRVKLDNGIASATEENTVQLGASYNFGLLRVFGQYTQANDIGLDVKSKTASTGVALPLGPGTVLAQMAYTTAKGPAVDRRHTTYSGAYVYGWDSVTDIYLIAMNDLVREQTRGVSVAAGVRLRF